MTNTAIRVPSHAAILSMVEGMKIEGFNISSAGFSIKHASSKLYPFSFIRDYVDIKFSFVTDRRNYKNKTETCTLAINIYYNHGHSTECIKFISECVVEKVISSRLKDIDAAMMRSLYAFTRDYIASCCMSSNCIPFFMTRFPREYNDVIANQSSIIKEIWMKVKESIF